MGRDRFAAGRNGRADQDGHEPVASGTAPAAGTPGSAPRPAPPLGPERPPLDHRSQVATRVALVLLALTGVEFMLGVACLFAIKVSRPTGTIPSRGAPIYFVHAGVGFVLVIGAMGLLSFSYGAARMLRTAAWVGMCGVAAAGIGGVCADVHPLRLVGMALMFIGAFVAGVGYFIPTLTKMPTERGTFGGP